MDWLQFFASIVQSLAWPVTAILAVIILRKPLSELLPLLQRFKYKELVLEFGKRLQEAQAEAATQLPAPERKSLVAPVESAAVRLASVSPRAAIIEAWRDVESAILTAAHSLGEPFFQEGRPHLVSAIAALESGGKVPRELADVLDDLRQLRNEAAHAPDFAVPVSEAIDYVRLSERMAAFVLSTVGDA